MQNKIITLKTASKSFPNMEMFTYFSVTLTNQNCMHIKIKWIVFMECVLPFPYLILHFLFQDIKIELHETVILSLVLHGCRIW
jgi:hypothetical protein